VDQKFRPTKLNELIVEAITNYDKFKELDESVKVSYLMFLAIKYFTNLEVAKTDTLEEQIRILNAMLDLEIFDKIVSEFPESELEKINDYMLKFNDRIDEFMKDGKSIEYLKEVFGESENIIDIVSDKTNETDDNVTDEVNEVVSKIEITE